jgi:Arc/MetJ family transcription regulator
MSTSARPSKGDHMTSQRVMQIQVVHSDRDALDSMITDLVGERACR